MYGTLMDHQIITRILPKLGSSGMSLLCTGAETSALPLLVPFGPNKHGEGRFQGRQSSHACWKFPDSRPHTPALSSFLPGSQRRSAATSYPPPDWKRARLPASSPLVFQPAGFSVISFPPCQTTFAGSILSKLIAFQKARS